ncbi:hypothetical protein FACS1894166_01070 [Bacilli bacterium]|nr:hypothetical protein FACS1894166_01070 [Bacilli bacterium]
MKQKKTLAYNSAKKKKILIGCVIGGCLLIGLSVGLSIGLTRRHHNFGSITLNNGEQITVRNATDFNQLCNNAPSNSEITVNGTKFKKNDLSGFTFGPEFNLGIIGNNFLCNCTSFNQPLTIPHSVDNIGEHFLAGCVSFNKMLSISYSVDEIGEGFLAECESFNQPLTVPDGVDYIGAYFLALTAFNQPLAIPNSVKAIGERFLFGCADFNQSLTIP